MRALAPLVALAIVASSCAAPATSAPSTATGAAATPSPSPSPLQKVKALWVAKVANMAPALVAQEAGYFREEGLDLSLDYVNGSPIGMAALVSGEVDFLQVAGSAVVTAAASAPSDPRSPVLIIGTVNKSVFKLMVAKGITSVEQLRGKTLFVSRPGTADEFTLKAFLRQNKLDPDKDVTILAAGSLEAAVAALDAKRGEAGVFSSPLTALLQSKGYVTLVDFATQDLPLLQLGAATTRAYAAAHPDTVTRFVRAYIRGIHRFKTDKAFAQKVMAKSLDISDQAQLDDAFDTYKDVFEKVPLPSEAAVKGVIDQVAQAKGLLPSAFIDDRFVKQVQADGFITRLYGN